MAKVAIVGCGVTGSIYVGLMADAEVWRAARGCVGETVAVASAMEIRLVVGDPIEHIPRLGRRAGAATPVNETVVALVKARESRFAN